MKIDRLIGILSVLMKRNKVTAPELAEKFEVSRRTINRDVETLLKAGIPLVTEQGAGGGISIVEGYKIDKTLLTSGEMQSVLMGLKSLSSVSGSKSFDNLMDKFNKDNEQVVAADSHLVIDLTAWNTRSLAPVIQKLQRAMDNNCLVKFTYYSPGGNTQRTVEPYLLVFRWYSWYLWSFCNLRQEFRLFKLGRMDQVEITEESFIPRIVADIKDIPKEVYNPDSIRVHAVFNPSVKWRLMEEFQRGAFKEEKDGSIFMDFTWSDKESLFSYLLGYRNNVEILGPPKLRKEFMELLKEMGEKYVRNL